MATTGLFCFSTDLRLDNNALLLQAAVQVDKLICLYCAIPTAFCFSRQAPNRPSALRQQFLFETLCDLNTNLHAYNQHLQVMVGSTTDIIPQLITQHNISHVYQSNSAGHYERSQWGSLRKNYPYIEFVSLDTQTLFSQSELPFALDQLPDTFSTFRKHVEKLTVKAPLSPPQTLPPSHLKEREWRSLWEASFYAINARDTGLVAGFDGGESAGRKHLDRYFKTGLARTYKETRNGLDGMDYSTKFSPWLANGSLSVQRILSELRSYEQQAGANDSTYWIYFELLWREYFHWYARKHRAKLFRPEGITQLKPKTAFYAERFAKWCHGNTPYPIVNACMKQLNASGYMSNRGRQLVASCFVHELNLDWRFGAAYMEQQLIDYDVASNWGNWQYLAGVGADPRGHRRFDLEKQTAMYDPKGAFIRRWQGDKFTAALDSVDASDWPIDRKLN